MSPVKSSSHLGFMSAPRVSGDEPNATSHEEYNYQCSPRERG